MEQSLFTPTTLDIIDDDLITLVRQHPELFDPRNESFRDWNSKEASWTHIATQLKRKKIWCISRWNCLLRCFNARKNMAKIRMPMSSKGWPYDDALSFLKLIHAPCTAVVATNFENCQVFSKSEFGASSSRSNDRIPENRDSLYSKLYDKLTVLAEKNESNSSNSATERPLQRHKSYKKRASARVVRVTNSGKQGRKISTLLGFHKSKENPGPERKITEEEFSESSCATVTVTEANLNNCLNHRFCMLLASRFRKMDAATAFFIQMKILELMWKVE